MSDIEKAVETLRDTNPMPDRQPVAVSSRQPVILPSEGEIPIPTLNPVSGKYEGHFLSTQEHTEAHGDVVKGYRKLTTEQSDAINEIKKIENEVGRALSRLQGTTEFPIDQRFISIGRTNLQQGFMALVRSIAQPESEL